VTLVVVPLEARARTGSVVLRCDILRGIVRYGSFASDRHADDGCGMSASPRKRPCDHHHPICSRRATRGHEGDSRAVGPAGTGAAARYLVRL
jgi:hypothetical protein